MFSCFKHHYQLVKLHVNTCTCSENKSCMFFKCTGNSKNKQTDKTKQRKWNE